MFQQFPLLQQQQIQVQLTNLQNAIQSNPYHQKLYISKALTLFHIHQYQQALKTLLKAHQIQQFKQSSLIIFMIGQAYYHLGKLSLAYYYYSKFQKNHHNHPQLLIKKAKVLLSQNQIQLAQNLLIKALGLKRNKHKNSRINYLIGICYFKRQMYKKGLYYFNQAIKDNRGVGDYYLLKGHCHYNIGQFDKSKQCYQQAISLNQIQQRGGVDGLIIVNSKLEFKKPLVQNDKQLFQTLKILQSQIK